MRPRWRSLGLAALALALVLATPLALDQTEAEHRTDDEHRLLVEVENQHDEEREVNVSLEGPRSWADDVTIPAEQTWRHEVDGPPGEYRFHIRWDDGTTITQGTADADNRGCLGVYRVVADVTGDGVRVRGGTCEGKLVAFHDLVEQARQAREAEEGDTVHVPVPRDGSEGEYLLSSSVHQPDWANATGFPFRWLPNATFSDAWGETIEGAEVVFGPMSRSQARAEALVTSTSVSAASENRIRYAGSGTDPIAYTQTSTLARSSTVGGSSSEVLWEVRFDAEVVLVDCLLRQGRQGTQIQAGSPAQPLCPGQGLEATWWTGPIGEHRGLRSVDLFGLDDPSDPTRVVKATWAHGIPHPVQIASIEVDREGHPHDRLAANLSHFEPEGTPLDELEDHDPQPPAIEEGPQRPLQGPMLGDDERMPFPLEEAVEAARMDPTLMGLQALLEEDAVLASAELTPRDRADTGHTRELLWRIAFTTSDEGPILVRCQRPMADTELGTRPVPAASCEEQDLSGEEQPPFPRLGPDDLAARSATWDEALDRWSLMDPDNATEPVTLAGYRPLLDTDANDEGHRSPSLEVGTDGGGPNVGPTQGSQAPTTVAIDPEDGRTRAFRTGVKEVGGLGVTGSQLSTTYPSGPGEDESSLVPDKQALVGATAGIGLLTLLAFAGLVLYSRLQDDEVLAHGTRRQIRDLVEAEPGIHANAIARRVDANDRTVEHHLDVLVREDVLTVLERGGYNHHFVQGQHAPKEMQALSSLQRGRAEEVYETVRQDPGLDLSSLAASTDISMAYASKLVDRLVDVGLVDRVREGRSARLYANEM